MGIDASCLAAGSARPRSLETIKRGKTTGSGTIESEQRRIPRNAAPRPLGAGGVKSLESSRADRALATHFLPQNAGNIFCESLTESPTCAI